MFIFPYQFAATRDFNDRVDDIWKDKGHRERLMTALNDRKWAIRTGSFNCSFCVETTNQKLLKLTKSNAPRTIREGWGRKKCPSD